MELMDSIFLDTNVLLDYLAARKPFDQAAEQIMQRVLNGQIELFISTLSVCNISYILRKIAPGSNIPQTLADLTAMASLTPIDQHVILAALDQPFKDFEDAVQYSSAFSVGKITHIITRNTVDFSYSQIPVMTPEDYLALNP